MCVWNLTPASCLLTCACMPAHIFELHKYILRDVFKATQLAASFILLPSSGGAIWSPTQEKQLCPSLWVPYSQVVPIPFSARWGCLSQLSLPCPRELTGTETASGGRGSPGYKHGMHFLIYSWPFAFPKKDSRYLSEPLIIL